MFSTEFVESKVIYIAIGSTYLYILVHDHKPCEIVIVLDIVCMWR